MRPQYRAHASVAPLVLDMLVVLATARRDRIIPGNVAAMSAVPDEIQRQREANASWLAGELAKDDAPRTLDPIEFGAFLELPLEKPRELIGSLVREASLGMIHAAAGAGKTYFALGMAISLTHGASFLGFNVSEQHQALYVDGEMPAFDFRERGKLLSTPLDKLWHPLHIVTPDLQAGGIPKIDSEEGATALFSFLDMNPAVKFVVLDNLACLTRPDGDDQHGAKSFSIVQDLMLECRRRHVACWIVHHSGKSGEQRGTSKRADVLDVIIRLTPVACAEGRTEITVSFEKGRHMRPVDRADFNACLEATPTGNGLMWTRSMNTVPMRDRIRAMLIDGMPATEIANELKTARSFVYRLKAEMQEAGELAKGTKKTTFSVVPSAPLLSKGQGTTLERGQNQGTTRGQRGQRHE
jgi:hypothetical protein